MAISWLTPSPYDSGKLSAMLAAIVLGFCEVSRAKEMIADGDRTIATAIVSPRARPRPSIDADTMPGRANGSTAIRIISQRVAPRARAASSCRRGTWRKTSRLSAVTIGKIITASTTATVRMVRPVPEAGPAKSGMKPRCSVSQTKTGCRAGASTPMPHRP